MKCVGRVIAVMVCGAGLGLAAAAGSAVGSGGSWLQRVPAKDHVRANPMTEKPEAVAAGTLLFKDHCQQCHQSNAMGDGRKKPSLRTERVRGATDGDLEWFMRQGNLAKGMPSWSSLPEAQRWQIIAYLRSLK